MGGLGFHKGGVYDVEGLTWTTTAPVDPTAEESFGWHVIRLDDERATRRR